LQRRSERNGRSLTRVSADSRKIPSIESINYMACPELIRNPGLGDHFDVHRFRMLHPAGRHLIAHWFERAWRERACAPEESFEPFIFCWIALNGWAACCTELDQDRQWLDALIDNPEVGRRFETMLADSDEIRQIAETFRSYWPVFKAQELRRLGALVYWHGDRLKTIDHYLRAGARQLSPDCWFSFDVIGNKKRFNFETSFQQYEADMEINTLSLLRKLDNGSGDLKKEILEIFVSKFMNFLRNPYSVKKVLNTIGDVLNFHPTDATLLAEYKAVVSGQKPHQIYLCSQLQISPAEYQMWLSALFMMFMRPAPTEPNFMESTVKGIFETPAGFPMVCVYRYSGEHSDKRCVLSDRGYSSPLAEPYTSFSFNLSSTAFII